MLTHADVCRRMLTHADACLQVSKLCSVLVSNRNFEPEAWESVLRSILHAMHPGSAAASDDVRQRCVCVCVCVRARARVCVCVCVIHIYMSVCVHI